MGALALLKRLKTDKPKARSISTNREDNTPKRVGKNKGSKAVPAKSKAKSNGWRRTLQKPGKEERRKGKEKTLVLTAGWDIGRRKAAVLKHLSEAKKVCPKKNSIILLCLMKNYVRKSEN